MKKASILISASLILGASSFFVGSVHALAGSNTINSSTRQQTKTIPVVVTSTPNSTPAPTITIQPVKRIAIKAALRKTNAIKEIDRRLESLNKLIGKLNGIKRISTTQRETFIAQVQIEATKLQELKTKIEAETDATILQEQKKSIADSYRIYALFIPKIEILAHADKIIEIADLMVSKTNDATLIAKIETSKAKAISAMDLVTPLLPEDYPDFKTTLQTARDMLKDARTNLNTVFPSLKAQ